MRAYSMDLRERVLLDSDAGMKAADVLQGGYWNSNSYAENRSVSLRQSNYCTL